MITLRQLRYLASLARHRHFGRAAEDCAISQPALSMQVRELEREIGVELVERRPGEITLTETGLEVARRAEQILAATRDLVDFARHRGRLLSGRLKLGIIPTLAPYVLPKVLPDLQTSYPDLTVELRETHDMRAARDRGHRCRIAEGTAERYGAKQRRIVCVECDAASHVGGMPCDGFLIVQNQFGSAGSSRSGEGQTRRAADCPVWPGIGQVTLERQHRQSRKRVGLERGLRCKHTT